MCLQSQITIKTTKTKLTLFTSLLSLSLTQTLKLVLCPLCFIRLQVFMALKIKDMVFWIPLHHVMMWQDANVWEDCAVSIFRLHPADGSSMILQNIAILPHHYMVTTQNTMRWITLLCSVCKTVCRLIWNIMILTLCWEM